MTASSVGGATMVSHGSHRAAPALQPRRRRRWLGGLVALLLLALLGAAGWLVGFSKVFAVRHVEVTGVTTLSSDQVRTTAAVPMGVPLVRQHLDAVAQRVAGLRVVRSVVVSRRWPDTVHVAVTERTARLAVAQPGGFVLVDDQGQAYLSVTSAPAAVAIAEVDPANAALLTRVAAVAQALPVDLRRRVRAITALTPDSITLKLTDGDVVLWGSAEESELKSQVLRALLKRPATRYDVSAPHSPALR